MSDRQLTSAERCAMVLYLHDQYPEKPLSELAREWDVGPARLKHVMDILKAYEQAWQDEPPDPLPPVRREIHEGPTEITQSGNMIDVTAPEIVEVRIDKDARRLWVNVDGICRFRACRIGYFTIDDLRNSQ